MTSFRNHFSTGYKDNKGLPQISPSQVSLIVAMLSAGTAVGALMSAPVGDFYGRRLSLILGIVIFCIGAIFQVTAHNIPLLVVGRWVHPFYIPIWDV